MKILAYFFRQAVFYRGEAEMAEQPQRKASLRQLLSLLCGKKRNFAKNS